MKDTKAKCVVAYTMAKHLLKNNFRIIDIKAHKDNPERTVFVFDNSEGKIGEAMKNYKLTDPCNLGVHEQL